MVILTHCWRLNVDQLEDEKLLGAINSKGPTHFYEFYLQKSHKVLMVKSQQRSLFGSGIGLKRITIVKQVQSVLYNKGIFYKRKTLPESYSIWRKGISPSPIPSCLPVSLKGGMWVATNACKGTVQGHRPTKRLRFIHNIIDYFSSLTPYYHINRAPVI